MLEDICNFVFILNVGLHLKTSKYSGKKKKLRKMIFSYLILP